MRPRIIDIVALLLTVAAIVSSTSDLSLDVLGSSVSEPIRMALWGLALVALSRTFRGRAAWLRASS